MPKILHILRILSIVGIVLIIVGGSKSASAGTDISKLNSATNLRHAGSILFVVLFALLVIVHLYFWANRGEILQHRRTVCYIDSSTGTQYLIVLLQMLIGISCAIPFLGVRVLYGILSSFAPLIPTESNGLSQFSLTTGAWGIYLAMSVLMEFTAVLIYTFVGITIPLEGDYPQPSTYNDSSLQTHQYAGGQQYTTEYRYPPFQNRETSNGAMRV